jgi:hypothetical protein
MLAIGGANEGGGTMTWTATLVVVNLATILVAALPAPATMTSGFLEPVMVNLRERRWTVETGDGLTFGRTERRGSVPIEIDPGDPAISRRAGRVRVSGDSVALENLSTKRPLAIEYPTVVRWLRVEPGAIHTFAASARVLVVGQNSTHPLDVTVPHRYRSPRDRDARAGDDSTTFDACASNRSRIPSTTI